MADDSSPEGGSHRDDRPTRGSTPETRRCSSPRTRFRGLTRIVARNDVRWLSAALTTNALLYAAYLTTHEYPAYGAGLYLQIAEQIRINGYALPAFIPGYTLGGVPFAYPPLSFYVAAVVRDLTGISPTSYALYVPGLLVLASLVPYYLTAKELLGSSRRAGIAGVLFASTPAVLQWHLSAGGITRSMAFLFTLVGAYVGIQLFRSRSWRWIPVASVLFGLTALTHPTYTVFFGLTYLLLFARFDPTLAGLASGAAVAAGGIALATPWVVQVVRLHGFDVFTAAAGTHSGLGGGLTRLLTAFVYPFAPNPATIFFLGAYLGGLYALWHRRLFLPAWLAVPGFVIGKPRFQFVAGSMLTTLLISDVLLPTVGRIVDRPRRRRVAKIAVVGVLVVAAVGVGMAFSASILDAHHDENSQSQPTFMDDDDRAAMGWAADNTERSARFVVLGDAAEWFPLFADRTILVGPWGVEWTTSEQYRYQLEFYRSISDCGDATCLTSHLQSSEFDPEYVYVPKDRYTVRGRERRQSDQMRTSMIAANRYELAYENEGVMVFRVTTQFAERENSVQSRR